MKPNALTTYTVTFERVGRNHNVAPLTAHAVDADHLAEEIYRYVRPHLRSRDVDVTVDMAEGKGYIHCGFHNGGTFAVAATRPGDAE